MKHALLVALSSAALLSGTIDAMAIDLRFGHVFAADSLENDAITSYADAVRERTDGEVNIEIYPAGQLGDVGGTFQALTLGTVDMSFVDISLLGYQKGHEEFFVGQVPYLFKSQEWAERIYNSEIYQPLYERLREEKGIRVLTVRGDRAPRSINTKVGPIFEPADAEGIRIRVLPNPVSIASFEAWGMRPTPINFNELYLALRQDLVAGQDNGLDVTVPMNFHEVTSYYAFSNHVYSLYGWYISEATWGRVPEEHQEILIEEAENAGDFINERGRVREQDDLRTILDASVKVTIPNWNAFAELTSDIHMEFEGELWPEGMVDQIKAMQEQD